MLVVPGPSILLIVANVLQRGRLVGLNEVALKLHGDAASHKTAITMIGDWVANQDMA